MTSPFLLRFTATRLHSLPAAPLRVCNISTAAVRQRVTFGTIGVHFEKRAWSEKHSVSVDVRRGQRCLAPGKIWAPTRPIRAYSNEPPKPTEKPAPPSNITKTLTSKPPLPTLTPHEQIYNLPNFLTLTRLLAAPVCGYLVLHHMHTPALLLFAYAGITDFIDGYLARKWHLQTVVGSVVDPMADKLLMTILVASLAATGAMPMPLAIVVLGRDVSLAAAALYYRYASLPGPKTMRRYWDFSLPSAIVHPTTVSKWNTLLQLLLIGWILVLPLLPSPPESIRTSVLDPLDSLLTSISSLFSTTTLLSIPPSATPESPHESSTSTTPSSSSPLPLSTIPYRPFTTTFSSLVFLTTLWSGFSYSFLKNAVTIIGKDEVLKAKQGRRGRAIIGLSYAGFVGVAGWFWATHEDVMEGGGIEMSR